MVTTVMMAMTSSVTIAQLGFFFSFFFTENAVIGITIQKMVNNIAQFHTFQIIIKLFKYMQPILKYSKNNMWFFLNGSKSHTTAYLAYVIN